jgi:hypothetical protein
MPHAITEAFSADDTLSEAAHGTAAAVASSRAAARKHEL